MKFAVVFPGQGSQAVGMLSELVQTHGIARQTFEEASDTLGYDIWKLISQGPDDQLNKTEYTQPAMLAAGVAVWRVFTRQIDLRPNVLAGHSLGEYSALVAANVLNFRDAIKAVQIRGQLMQAAVPEGQGAMAAILGLNTDEIQTVCRQSETDDLIVEAVNFNSPGQVVISGHAIAVERAINAAKAAGAKFAMRLPVSVPSHSSLMRSAAEKLAKHLKTLVLQPIAIPIVHNVDAATHERSDAIISALQAQLHKPVLWVDCINRITQDDINLVIEFGPGKVLAGLCKRINKQLQLSTIDCSESLQKSINILTGAA